jgi:hypothetical protein
MPYGYGASKNYGGSTARERGAARNRTQSTSTKKSSPSKTTNYNNNTKKSVTSGTLSDPREKDDTAAKMDLFKNDPYTKKQGGPLILRPLEFAFDAGAKKTRTFFTEDVLTSKRAKKNIGYTKEEFSKLSRTKQEEVYKGYLAGRSSNTTDAYGNRIPQRRDDRRVITQVQKAAVAQAPAGPTTTEVSQSTSAYGGERTDAQETLRVKKRGRKQTILTQPTGLGGSEPLITKKKLLG